MFPTNSSSTSDMLETNAYLGTIFQPWKNTNVRIPDLDMTASRAKSATLTNNFTVLKDQLLLQSVPANNQGQLRLYARTTLPGPSIDSTMFNGYLYVTTLPLDEQLSDSYVYGRLISSGLRVSSATRPTGTVDINGTINAIHYQDLPSLKNLTFSSIPSYKRNNVDVKSQISVADGVVSLHQPFGEQQFNVFDTTAVEHAETILDISRTFGAGVWPAGAVPANANANVIYYQAGTAFPEGIRGRLRISVTVNVSGSAIAPAASAWELQVTAYTPRLSIADWNSVTTVVVGGTASFLIGTVGATATMDFFTDAELRGLQFTLQNRNAAAQDPAVTLAVASVTFTMESFAYYDKGYNGPGALIGISGLNPPTANYPGQVMSIAGVYNYEVVPNSFLARQVGTEYGTEPENPLLMKAAEFHITNSEMPFLYSGKEYDTAMAIGRIENKISNGKVLEAAGFGDFLKQLFNATKPILSAVPVLGPVVDALTSSGVYRPQATAAGVYNNQTSSGGYRYPTNPPRRLNGAYVGEYLDVISSLPDPVVLNAESYEVGPEHTFAVLNQEGRVVRDGNSNGSVQQGTLSGLIAQVNYGYVSNRFMLVDEANNRAYIGYVYASSQPLVADYKHVEIPISDTERVVIQIASNVTLTKDALWALGTSAFHAGKPSDFITVISPMAGELKGPSLGLAALLSMCRRNTYAALSGFVDADGTVVAISKLEAKLNGLQSDVIGRSIPLITPYDDALEDAYLNLLREKGEVVDTYASQIGEFGVTGRYPRLIFVNNITAVFLAAINLNFLASGSRYTAGAVIPEIKIEGMEVKRQTGEIATQYIPVKELDQYDWGYGKGGPEALIRAGKEMGPELQYMAEFDKDRSTQQAGVIAKKINSRDYAGLANVLRATLEYNSSIRKARALDPREIRGKMWTLEDAENYMLANKHKQAFSQASNPAIWQTVRKHGSALAIVAGVLSQSGGKAGVSMVTFANPVRRVNVANVTKSTVGAPTTTSAPQSSTTTTGPSPASSSSSTSMAQALTGDLPPPSDLFSDEPTFVTMPVEFKAEDLYLPPKPVVPPPTQQQPQPAPAPAPAPAVAQPASTGGDILSMLQQIMAAQAATDQRVNDLAKKGRGPAGVARPAKQ